jgi:hypothetical protein
MKKLKSILTLCLLVLLTAVASAWEKDRPAIPPVIPPNPGNLPRVLLIGDSISGGYHKLVAKALEGKAVVAKSSDNGESTAVGVKKIDGWLGDTRWDVIHFNWGVWDMYGWQYAADDRSPAAYAQRLETLVVRMKKTEAKLIWATTTPVPPKPESTMLKRWKKEVVIDQDLERQYQEAALQVMKKHGVQVDDLYALLKPRRSEFQADDNVHFSAGGSALMAKQVADCILKALGGERQAGGSAPGLVPTTTRENVMSLAGAWRFRLDPENIGVEKRWFTEKLDDSVMLPGTTDTNQKGVLKDERAIDRLSRVWYWKGPAWYQREVDVPATWKGKRITLLLERTKNVRVWVDDKDCGAEDTLSALQIFDLTRALTPGRHAITVLVDNAKLPPVGPAHAVDERTQSNWNGIIGRLELRATDPVWIADAQVYPDAARKQARIRVVIGNMTGQSATGKLIANCRSYNVAKPADFAAQSIEVRAPDARNVVEFTYEPGGQVPLWDEFQPAMLRLDLQLTADAGGQAFADRLPVGFGMRDFKRDGQRLAVNGRTVFLRGRLDCANYPLTGYPPMDKDGWLRVLGILKEWGLNHVRFHSWCPPEAAFMAADELGMYFQVELPNKRSAFKAPESPEAAKRNIDYLEVPGADPKASLYDYAVREGELIFQHFGNHPSFVMFTLGNELGRNPAMYELVDRFKKRDPRHLFAQGSNNNHWQPSYAEGDDFWVTGKTGKNLPVRGAFFPGDYPGGGHIYSQPPSTLVNYHDSIKDVPVPVIGHETAEFEVTPDFREIPKYTGVFKARNLEAFQQRLKDANMLDLSHDFMRASGALAAICQREDIEAALRTPGLGGFHLLDLQDFPGQGTALVGMLNVFMESKGIITPEERRQHCCETVPLLLMEKYTWTTDETFTGEIKVAHYGAADMLNARVNWTLLDEGKSRIASGTLGPQTIKAGGLHAVGQMRVPVDKIKAPCRIKASIAIEGTPYSNTYDLWIYPPKVDTGTPKGVLVTNRLDAATRQFLADGGKVLLFSRTNDLKHTVGGAFPTDFWCWPMFAKGAIAQGLEPVPGTQGFICDPKHPALAAFPTEFHSNWQWWQIVKNSRPIILDATPADYRPIIHVIDNFARNHKLGLLFETKVGKGRLLVCASDLPALQDHPEARQLLHSLLLYVDSTAFAPQSELAAELLKKLIPE